MKNIQKSAEQQEPEWPPIEDAPPPRGLLEKALPTVVLIAGILCVLAAIADVLFFNIGSREDHMVLGVGGMFYIWVSWVANTIMGG